MGVLELILALLSPTARTATMKAMRLGLGGNLFGDGWQNGGCLVVEKGGGDEPLLYYIQQNPSDHVSNRDVLQVSYTHCYRSALKNVY